MAHHIVSRASKIKHFTAFVNSKTKEITDYFHKAEISCRMLSIMVHFDTMRKDVSSLIGTVATGLQKKPYNLLNWESEEYFVRGFLGFCGFFSG